MRCLVVDKGQTKHGFTAETVFALILQYLTEDEHSCW